MRGLALVVAFGLATSPTLASANPSALNSLTLDFTSTSPASS